MLVTLLVYSNTDAIGNAVWSLFDAAVAVVVVGGGRSDWCVRWGLNYLKVLRTPLFQIGASATNISNEHHLYVFLLYEVPTACILRHKLRSISCRVENRVTAEGLKLWRQILRIGVLLYVLLTHCHAYRM